MIARFSFVLPFRFAVKVGDSFADAEVEVANETYWIHSPRQSIFLNSDEETLGVGEPSFAAMSLNETDQVKVDGHPTYSCDLLQVDIKRADFDRAEAVNPVELVDLAFTVVNAWLSRVRVIAGAPWVRPLVQNECSWELAYLNDDGSDLERLEGLIRRLRGVFVSSGGVFALKTDSWQELNGIAADYVPPTWDTLILDAQRLFPDPGPVVVLAMTAIETRIGTACGLPSMSCAQPEKIAHQGRATFNGKELERDQLGRLVNDSKRIASWITDLLPAEHRPPTLKVQTRLEVTQQFRA